MRIVQVLCKCTERLICTKNEFEYSNRTLLSTNLKFGGQTYVSLKRMVNEMVIYRYLTVVIEYTKLRETFRHFTVNTITSLTQVHINHRVRCDAESRRCVHVQMEPRAVLVLVGRPIQEHHLALVPALIRLLDAGQIQRGGTERRIGGHARYATHVALAAVRRIVLVPDVDGDFLALCVCVFEY